MNKRSEILRMAESLVNGDRNRQYGDPQSDFLRTADLWETYLNGTHEKHMAAGLPEDVIMIEPHDVAVLMILLKVSRIAWSPEKEDSWTDLAGYAACGWDCASEDEDAYEDSEEYCDCKYPVIAEEEHFPTEDGCLQCEATVDSYPPEFWEGYIQAMEDMESPLTEQEAPEQASGTTDAYAQMLMKYITTPNKPGSYLGGSLFPFKGNK